MLICRHCATRHVVEALEEGRDPGAPPSFDETPAEHMAKHHSDREAGLREWVALEQRIAALPMSAFELLGYDLGNATPPKERH